MKNKKIKICPKCESRNIFLYFGGMFGILYKCNNCKYVGPLVIEEFVKMSKKIKKTKRSNKTKERTKESSSF